MTSPVKSETSANSSSPSLRPSSPILLWLSNTPSHEERVVRATRRSRRRQRTLLFTARDIQVVLNDPSNDSAAAIGNCDSPPAHVEKIYCILSRISFCFLIPLMPSYFLRRTGVGTILDSGPQMTASWEITVLIPEAEVAHIRKMVLAECMYLHRHQLT